MRVVQQREQWRRPDASMSLLNDIFARPLDPGYLEAAEQKAARGETSESPDPRVRFSPSMVLGMVALGLLLTVAALQVRDSAPVVTEERESLIERVRAEDEFLSDLNADLTALEQEVSALESSLLQNTAVGQALRNELTKVEALVGAVPVTGPGIVVTLRDAEEQTQTGASGELVLAVDLKAVLNGLWAAGAEAIAINGQRVTPLTSVQGVQQVPQVNQRPLTSPYEVEAIGDGNTLATRFSEGSGGEWLRVMARMGPTFDISTAGELELPASSTSLVIAQPQEVS